jgi:F0F1-type ATP synthase membrane subunit c/vacuolar-type H+-ATPase subunit K
MVEAQEKSAMDKGMRTLWFIWAAMLVSLLIYVFICHQPGIEFKGVGGTDFPIGLLRNIFFGSGAAAWFMAYFMRRSMLSVRAGISKPKPVERMVKWDAPPYIAKYATAVIVSLALSESIGIYGFVLFLLGGGFKTLYTFIGISALAMVFYRPKREEMEKLAMAYKQVGEESH